MPDYQQGKIYKITAGDLTYIGSTCEPTLARRLSGHVKNYKKWKKGNCRLTTAFNLIDTGNYEITLIELYPCNSKDELTSRERFYIETTVCINKVKRPIITNDERIERCNAYAKTFRENPDNKETQKEYHAIYRQKHTDELKLKKKEYYQRTKNKEKQEIL